MPSIAFVAGPLKGRTTTVSDAGMTIGRGHSCDITLTDKRISREHASLRIADGSWWIYDLRSSNGTTVNGNGIEAARLNDGDRIVLGASTLIFSTKDNQVGDPLPLTATARAGNDEPTICAGPSKTNGPVVASQPPTTVTSPGSKASRQPKPEGDDKQAVDELHDAYDRMTDQIARVIVGQKDVIEQTLIAIFCRGHALLVGVPGLAKTLLVSTLSHVLDLSFKRVQFTPDLMPSDITGTDVLEEDHTTGRRAFRFVKGPIFANMLLADEINRTPPKTQAALLEAMQEHRVTAGDQTYHLPEPFFVLATQNPIEQEGTYPLPEAQLDRFMLNIVVEYPSPEEEQQIISQVTGAQHANLDVTLSGEEVLRLQQVVRRVPVADHVVQYARELTRATRPKDPTAPDFVREMVGWGAGPRAGIYLISAAKAHAVLRGRYHATTADVTQAALPVLRHRVITTFNAEAAGIKSDDIIRMLVEKLQPGEKIDL